MQEAQSVEATYNIAQARSRSLGWSLKAVPGPMVESACMEGPGEAGQGR